jgi:hypothetical protein
MYIVGFNGPPQSGKDTLANFVADLLQETHGGKSLIVVTHTNTPLRRIAYPMVGYNYPTKDMEYESFKKTTFEPYGRTGRELLIDVSEVFLKVAYGEDILGRILLADLNQIKNTNAIVLVPDCGFQHEVNVWVKALGVANTALVQVHRRGCDFKNDSRGWTRHPDESRMHFVYNNHGLVHLKKQAEHLVKEIARFGWQI